MAAECIHSTTHLYKRNISKRKPTYLRAHWLKHRAFKLTESTSRNPRITQGKSLIFDIIYEHVTSLGEARESREGIPKQYHGIFKNFK